MRPGAAFTRVELLAIVAVVAIVGGVLAAAFARARSDARTAMCLSNESRMALMVTTYTHDFRGWFPVMPVGGTASLWTDQNINGGVAGLFSLEQRGDGVARGVGGSSGGAAYADGNRTPVFRSYVDDIGVLTCPADRRDHAPVGATTGAPVAYSGAGLEYPPGGPVKRPRTPVVDRDITNYNISYLYVAGLRPDEGELLCPAPLWGDETDGYDVGAAAWYGAGANPPGTRTAASIAAGAPCAGRYAPIDNHGSAGANFVFTDGHGAFLRDSVYDTYFRPPGDALPADPRNINFIDRFRSARTQVID